VLRTILADSVCARIFEMQVPLGNRTSVTLHVSGGNLGVVVVVRVTVVTVVV